MVANMNPKQRIKRILPIIEYSIGLKEKKRKSFLTKLDSNVVKAILDLIFNVFKGNLSIKPEIVDNLRKHKKFFYKICAPKLSLANRKKQLVNNKVFFKTIFPMLVPELVLHILPKIKIKEQASELTSRKSEEEKEEQKGTEQNGSTEKTIDV